MFSKLHALYSTSTGTALEAKEHCEVSVMESPNARQLGTTRDSGQAIRQGRSLEAIFELESPLGRDFDNPSHEWRRLFSEILGTFFLVLVGAGGGVVGAFSNGAIERAAAVTAPGLMVLAIIL